MRRILVAVAIVVIAAVASLVATIGGALGPLFDGVRPLAEFYLFNVFNAHNATLTAMSPEAVTSIVWDYRGLDTLFETVVFYMAIIGCVALYRGIELIKDGPEVGLSRIVKTVTKILIVVNIAVAASIALHGHLTPGGGFQAGAAMAVAPIIIIVVFSRFFLMKRGITKEVALSLRSIGLLGIALVALIPLMAWVTTGTPAYVMQNQVKVGSSFSFPAYIGKALVSGSLIWYNIFEFLAVSFGFTILFLLLSIDEKTIKKALVGEKHEY